jgi:hypothetical protein
VYAEAGACPVKDIKHLLVWATQGVPNPYLFEAKVGSRPEVEADLVIVGKKRPQGSSRSITPGSISQFRKTP